MNLMKSIVAAALVVTTTLSLVPAAEAQSRYRDHEYRGHRGDRGDWRRWDRDRDGIPNRYDRYDNRRYGWNDGYRYRDSRRCWTETRWDRWSGQRYRVRLCR